VAERFHDFLIRVRGLGPSGRYPVESESGEGSRAQGELSIDPQALLARQLDPTAYGVSLFESLFSGPIARTYEKAIGQAQAETGGRLRVRLWIEPEAAELHAIPWERLYHSPQGQPIPLATSALNPFSRYTALDARDPEPVPTRPIGLLFALSNPTNLPEGLKPLDVDNEVRVLHEALGDLRRANRIRVTLVPGRTGLSPDLLSTLEGDGYEVAEGPTTFETLTRLARRHEIVHFVGHGFFGRDQARGEGHAALYLEKEDGGWAAAPDVDLVDRVAPLEPPPPYLMFLSACQSARQEADAAHPFVGLGPKLVQAGVPAVVGMQAAIAAEVNRELVGEFYRNLFEHGVVDLALNQARLALYRRRDVDWAIPVLFSRLRGGRLFVPDELANRVVTAEGILQETEHGAVVTKASPDRPERIPPPVRLLPRRTDLLGRTEEVAEAADNLSQGRPVEFHAAAGSGKTTLLRALSFQPPENAPDGVVYLSSRNLPVDDLLEALYQATYTTAGAYKPSPTQIRQLLQDVRVLVVLDDADLTREDVQRLIDSVPGASFLLASTERNLWGEGRAIDLKGLPEDVAIALFEREMGTEVSAADRAEVTALCGELQGNPLRIIQAAGRVRGGSSISDLRREVAATPPAEALGAADLRTLSPAERTVLSILAALDGAAIDPDHLAALTGLPDAPAILEHLQELGLAKTASPRFTLTEPASDSVESGLEIERTRQDLLEHFIAWTEGHQGDPGQVLEQIDPIMATLAWGRSEHRSQEFLRLARAVEEALIIGRRWATWRSLLRQEVEAAEALGDQPARGRALHQLGTQALGQDAKRSAKRYLKEALQIRKGLGDREGARITRHNLKLLPTFLIPPFVVVTFLVLAVGALTVAGATIFVGGSAAVGLRSDPAGVAFAETLLGNATRTVIHVLPTGPPVVIENVALQPLSSDFVVVHTDCSGRIEAQGCIAVVVFDPQSPGPLQTELVITYNGPKSPLRIALSGIGTGIAEVALDPDHVALSAVIGTKRRVQVEVANLGSADLQVLDASTDVSGFDVEAGDCERDAVPPGKSCSITVIFAPTARGQSLGALTIDHDAPNSPVLVQLSGVGLTDKPDLVVRNVVVGQIFTAEGSIAVPITVWVVNDADIPAGTFTVSAEWTASGADDFTQTRFAVLSGDVANDDFGNVVTLRELAPDEVLTIEGALVFDEKSFLDTTIDIRITADSAFGKVGDPVFHQVDEFNEDNNTFILRGVLLNPVQ
jgi:hypothetical protein